MTAHPGESRVAVRPARAGDADAFLGLVDALAEYEKLAPPDAEARRRLVEDGFGERPRFTLLLAEREGRAVGYVILLETYSSFLARPTLYIEDLFLLEAERGRGAGREMMRAVAREAVRRGCHRIEGIVLNWNEPAQRFYAATGGRVMDEWWLLRYDRDAVERLAGPA